MASIVTAIRSAVPKERKQSIITLDEGGIILPKVTEFCPTCIPWLDMILGGGWALGRASEVYGPTGCGKSSLMHLAMLGIQRIGGSGVIYDYEHAFEERVIKQLGLDPKRFLVLRPSSAEEGWAIMWKMLEKARAKDAPPLLFGWDSVALTPTEDELTGGKRIANLANVMTANSKRLFYEIAQCRAHVMFLNQERTKIGGNKKFVERKTVGGDWVDYATSTRVRCTRYAMPAQVNPKEAYMINLTADKNRLVTPHQKAQYTLDFHYGPSYIMTLYWILKDADKIKSAGGGYYKMTGHKAKFKRRWWHDLFTRKNMANFRRVAEGHYNDLMDQARIKPPGLDSDQEIEGGDET